MQIAGHRYISTGDPGPVGYGYEWFDATNGVLYSRNQSNTEWIRMFDTYGDNIKIASDLDIASVCSGLARIDVEGLSGSPRKSLEEIATLEDIALSQQSMSSLINARFSRLQKVYSGGSGQLSSYIQILTGGFSNDFGRKLNFQDWDIPSETIRTINNITVFNTIPLPIFQGANGRIANINTDNVVWIASPAYLANSWKGYPDFQQGGVFWYKKISETTFKQCFSHEDRTLMCSHRCGDGEYHAQYTCPWYYMIVAIKGGE